MTRASSISFPAVGPLGRLSALLCVACALTGAAAELVLAWVWLSPSLVESLVAPRLGLAGASLALDGATRLIGFAVSMLPMLVLFYVLHQASALFDGYRLGRVFTAAAPLRLRRIGLGLVALAGLRPVTATLLGLVLTYANAPGQRMLVIGFSLDDVLLALVGGLIVAIGHVMVEANALAEDQRAII